MNVRYPDLQVNAKRALCFLRLAVEQLRIFDYNTADVVHKQYLERLIDIFDHVLKQVEHCKLDEAGQKDIAALELLGDGMFNEVVSDLPLSPPGLGFQLLPEARVKRWDDWNDAGSMSSDAPVFSPPPQIHLTAAQNQNWIAANSAPSSQLQDGVKNGAKYGVIGQDRPGPISPPSQVANTARRSPSPGPSYAPALPQSFTTPQTGTKLSAPSLPYVGFQNAKPRRPSGLSNMTLVSPAQPEFGCALEKESQSASSGASQEESSSDERKQENVRSTHQRSHSSWAKIAAITPETAATLSEVDANRKLMSSNKPSNSHASVDFCGTQTHRHPNLRILSLANRESATDRLRVVWIANLPANYTLRDVSVRIEVGPVMSILLENDVSPDILGRSACIIFQHAESASAFLAANGVVKEFDTTTTTETNQEKATVYAANGAPSATIFLGAPLALDADLVSMATPTCARRRLKWARSRLFYDVPLARFKADVIRLCGPQNVELFHFYNPGEATVVFSSVAVAAWVLNAFRSQKGKGTLRWGDRYQGVDVAYAHDFNEAPAKLYTQYGPDGRVRKVHQDVGLEGLFSGPSLGRGVEVNYD